MVLPLNDPKFNPSHLGLRLGSVVAVIYRDKLVYAVIGDRGPKYVIGEGSEKLAAMLGIPTNSKSGGVGGRVVTYIAFTGTSAMVSPIENHALAETIGHKKASELIGGKAEIPVQPAPLVKGDNAVVSGDTLYIRDEAGSQIPGRWVDDGDSIRVSRVNFERQLLFVEYPTPGGTRSGWVTNASKLLSYTYEDQYVVGAAREVVYDEAGAEIGSLDPNEKATPLYRGSNGLLFVIYDTVKGPNTKGGFVKNSGGFSGF